jgi:hypothetical protein
MMFGLPKAEDYPRQWKDMSFDFKLMFVYHGCMMILFITGGAFSLHQELTIAGALLLVLITLSIRHRRLTGWRWQSVKPKNYAMAAGVIALMGVFLYAATPLVPASNPRFLPWFLAGFGIGAFNVLQAVRLVYPSEAAFLVDCREPSGQFEQAIVPESTEPAWHRVVRGTYSTLFFVVWLEFVGFFYYSGAAFRDDSSGPTPTRPDAVTEHGKTVYVTHAQKVLSDKLELFAFIGIPSVIVGGLVLHFLVGVKLYPNAPTLREFLARKSSGN